MVALLAISTLALFCGSSALTLRSGRRTDNKSSDDEQWNLWPKGALSWRLPGKELLVPADPTDPLAQQCAPTDNYGLWYRNTPEPTLVPFIVDPGRADRSDAAVVVIPGGGYKFLAWTKEGIDPAKWLNSLGVNAFILKYRVPLSLVDLQAQLEDVQRALSLVRSRAEELGLNKSKIGAVGFSAGGDLAARATNAVARAYRKVDEADGEPWQPDFQVLVYGALMFDLPSRRPPPTFVTAAWNDPCVPPTSSVNYYNRARQLGGTAELHMFKTGGHGYGTCDGPPFHGLETCAWVPLATDFLNRQVLHRVA